MLAKTLSPDLQEELVGVIAEAVSRAFRVQANMEVTQIKNEREKARKLFPASLMSEIAINGKDYTLLLVLVIPAPVALKVYGSIIGEELSEITDEVKEFPLELSNMILGETKRILNERGREIAMARPKSIDVSELVSSKGLTKLHTYNTAVGEFFLCLCQREGA